MPEHPELSSVPVGKIKTILFSQPKPDSEKSPFYDLAKRYNVKVDFRPFIQVAPVEGKDFRTAGMRSITIFVCAKKCALKFLPKPAISVYPKM
jgi:hypothetical protein